MAKIALAEDDSTMVRLLSTLLRMDGYEVEAVSGSEDVPAAVARIRPDVLVMDMILAHQNGLELVDLIRRGEGGTKMYIIMISGLSVRDDCIRRGADAFLQKPFMPEDLMGMLQKHLHSAS